MKKILLSLMLFVTMFTIIVCGNTNKIDETLFKIKDKEFHLDTDKEFEGLNYKTSMEFREINNGTPMSKYVQYNYQPEDSSNYFFFRIFYYTKKDFTFVRSDLAIDKKDGTIHSYFINKDGNTYVLHFVSQNDIKDFENKVLNSIKFE